MTPNRRRGSLLYCKLVIYCAYVTSLVSFYGFPYNPEEPN